MTAKSPVSAPAVLDRHEASPAGRAAARRPRRPGRRRARRPEREREVGVGAQLDRRVGWAASPGRWRRSPSSKLIHSGARAAPGRQMLSSRTASRTLRSIQVLLGVVVDGVRALPGPRGRCPARAPASAAAPCPGRKPGTRMRRDRWRTDSSMARWSCSRWHSTSSTTVLRSAGRVVTFMVVRSIGGQPGGTSALRSSRRNSRRERKWWNGRHAGLRSQSSQEGEGSIPSEPRPRDTFTRETTWTSASAVGSPWWAAEVPGWAGRARPVSPPRAATC